MSQPARLALFAGSAAAVAATGLIGFGGFRFRTIFRAWAPLALSLAAMVHVAPARDWTAALGTDELLFVKRFTYAPNHYYTEFINSPWTPGGNLCLLNLKDGSVRELVPQLRDGVFGRFDLSFDAQRVVFAWKAGPLVGYRLYEVHVDGSGLRQCTFPPPDEEMLIAKYRLTPLYHHGTDDMDPCYLPDGGVAFISTRCQYSVICDGSDNFTTTVLYRIDADSKNLRKLTNSPLSEATPSVLPDGRLLYTRWEYVDKGASVVKCLWAMRPDGTGSVEIYGNHLAMPPTLLSGRAIPGAGNRYVALGTPHYPHGGVGTVLRIDARRNVRTRGPMSYVTPGVDIQAEGGFAFRAADGTWQADSEGKGRLFKDPYPLSEEQFLVAHKPVGAAWNDPRAYGLCLLDQGGRVDLIYRDSEISSWLPYPVKPRPTPPVLPFPRDERLARARQAVCLVSDVYRGLEGVPRGTIKHLRVLEQVPRPWAARRTWPGDEFGQQHACISKWTHLGLKVQHGVVPVENDGSACFLVPAEANIFLQALDASYVAVQTERTYVNYMPGEIRGCVGCHGTQRDAVSAASAAPSTEALLRKPVLPGPQPGEATGRRALDYVADVQPVWDRHCVGCHNEQDPQGGLDLSGTLTSLFNVSYENLMPDRRPGGRDRNLVGSVISELHPRTGSAEYLPPWKLGSATSVLAAMLAGGRIELADPVQADRVRKLAPSHREVRLSDEELLKVTNWIDTNCQYYGTYWGRKNLRYRDHPAFRPVPTFEMATAPAPPSALSGEGANAQQSPGLSE